jgi:predicted enzyme related to lactoylglutathione lyase
MKFKEIAFTGYPVTDMARARQFYEGVLGLTTSRTWGDNDAPSWLEYDIGPGCLALVADENASWPPANAGPAAALEVDDFEACIAKLKAAGIKFLWEPQETPVCWMAVVLDPDENRLVIHRRKAG